MTSKQVHSFNVKMTADQYAMLQQLSTDASISKADIVRQSISNRFQQTYANVPKCANNNACLCPQMHHLQNIPKHSDSDLLKKVQEGSDV